jgi:GGDEF domain-containing protein
LSVEILAMVVLVGGLFDLALLLFAMYPGRDSASDRGLGSVTGGRAGAAAVRGARRRELFVAAADGDARESAPRNAAGSPRAVEPRRGAMPMTDRLPFAAATPPIDPLPTAGFPSPPAEAPFPMDDGAQANRRSERGPAIVARMSHASQAFGVGDPNLPLEETPGVEGALGWARIVEVEGSRLLRYRRPVTALLAEVDGLPRLVDRLGEEPVRRLLVVVGDMFRREARASDWVASIAPGRYAVLLTETDENGAAYYAERVRRVCEPWLGSAAVPLALAIGWSGAPASSDLQFTLHRAEERMHADRRAAGRIARRPTSAAVHDHAVDRAADAPDRAGTVASAGTPEAEIWLADDGADRPQ